MSSLTRKENVGQQPNERFADAGSHRETNTARIHGDPTVAAALTGFLALACLVSWRERAADERARLGLLPPARDPAVDVLDLTRWSARELRALPGLGERRAVAIVRARWAGEISGQAAELDELRGIGPETVRAIRAELERGTPRPQRSTATAERVDTNVTP